MSKYFPKTCEPFGGDINVKVDLSNYATKIDIKNIFHVDTSSYRQISISLKVFQKISKNKVEKLNINKLVAVPVDLSKLSNAKIKNIEDRIPDTKTILNTKIPSTSGLETIYELTAVENKVPSVTNLVKKSDYDTKLNDIEKELLIIPIENILLLQNLIN